MKLDETGSRKYFVLAGLLAIVGAGLAACAVVAPHYAESVGTNTAAVRAAWQDAARADSKIRIAQVDGRNVSPLMKGSLSITGGVRQIGVDASVGNAAMYQCVTFLAEEAQRYLVAVAGPERDWSVTVTNEDVKEKVLVLDVVRAPRESCPARK